MKSFVSIRNNLNKYPKICYRTNQILNLPLIKETQKSETFPDHIICSGYRLYELRLDYSQNGQERER